MRRLNCSVRLRGTESEDANTSWIFALPVGRPFHDGNREREISHTQAQSLLLNTRRAMAYFESVAPPGGSPYRFPIKAEHRGVDRFGDIVGLKLAGDGDWFGIWEKVRWNDQTWEAIQASEVEYVSIGVDSYRLEDGTEISPCIVETSLTNHPRIQSLGRIQDTLAVRLSQHVEETEMEELEELLNTITQTLTQIVEQQAETSQQVAQLADQIESLEAENTDDEEEPEGDDEPAEEEPDEEEVAADQNDPDDDGGDDSQEGDGLRDTLGELNDTIQQMRASLDELKPAQGDPHTQEKGGEDPPEPKPPGEYTELRDFYMDQGDSLEEAQSKALAELDQ